jgi:glycosyltransferase involved in cell wall biosynthesis
LIIGPIGDFGGREIEAGYVAKVLSRHFHVRILSTGIISEKSQVFGFIEKDRLNSLRGLIYRQSFLYKILCRMAYLRHKKTGNILDYMNNKIAALLMYKTYEREKATEEIKGNDLIIIIGQLSSYLVEHILNISSQNKIPVLFRTTGTIHANENYSFLNKVSCFIHHSQANAANLKISSHKYVVIDQCCLIEQPLLALAATESQVKIYLIIGRLSKEKGYEKLIDNFISLSGPGETLIVAGDGPLLNSLKEKHKDAGSIKFFGFVDYNLLPGIFGNVDALVISSPEESGPLVGIEAMASGRIIISTKVGAMKERLEGTGNNFWFEYDDRASFGDALSLVRNLTKEEVKSTAAKLRRKYKANYSEEIISKRYLEIVNEYCG